MTKATDLYCSRNLKLISFILWGEGDQKDHILWKRIVGSHRKAMHLIKVLFEGIKDLCSDCGEIST